MPKPSKSKRIEASQQNLTGYFYYYYYISLFFILILSSDSEEMKNNCEIEFCVQMLASFSFVCSPIFIWLLKIHQYITFEPIGEELKNNYSRLRPLLSIYIYIYFNILYIYIYILLYIYI